MDDDKNRTEDRRSIADDAYTTKDMTIIAAGENSIEASENSIADQKKKLKKPGIRQALAFLLILVLLLTAAGICIRPAVFLRHGLTPSGQKNCVDLMKEEKDSIDVLVVGDSESYTSFSPMDLWENCRITGFDAGKSAATIAETEGTLKEALSNQKPRVVLLETNNLFRYNIGGNPADSAFADRIYQIFPVLRMHNAWKNYFLRDEKPTWKGYKFSAKVEAYDGKIEGTVVTGDTIPADSIRFLDSIAARCEKSGAALVLYSAPSPKCYTKEKTEILQKIAAERNLPYIDMNAHTEEIGIDWAADTRDHGDHLNTSGAEKVTAYLGQYLKEHYTFKDHDGTALADSWDALSQKYEARQAEILQEIKEKACR